jgi:hypothetical protein
LGFDVFPDQKTGGISMDFITALVTFVVNFFTNTLASFIIDTLLGVG